MVKTRRTFNKQKQTDKLKLGKQYKHFRVAHDTCKNDCLKKWASSKRSVVGIIILKESFNYVQIKTDKNERQELNEEQQSIL